MVALFPRNNPAAAKTKTPEQMEIIRAAVNVPGAINIPHRLMDASLLSHYPAETLFVVYCAGPHCNGVHRAAIKLSQLGFAVKEMIGGVTGWRDEGLPLNYAKNSSVDQSNDAVSCGCHS
ncbi:putative rhodanese-like protein [Yersinia frederiksenii]|nr:putative rhodanese-like protein [Yersinia frederiksenii]